MKKETKKFYVGQSKIHNKGIFAIRDIKKGEIISHFVGKPKFLLVTNKKESLSYPNWVGIGKNRWIEIKAPEIYINHSCDPNAGIKGKILIVAIKDIKQEKEITFDYSIIEGDLLWEMNCKCGVKNCRKTIKSIQFLPKKQFNKYIPYIPNYFKSLYFKNHKKLKIKS